MDRLLPGYLRMNTDGIKIVKMDDMQPFEKVRNIVLYFVCTKHVLGYVLVFTFIELTTRILVAPNRHQADDIAKWKPPWVYSQIIRILTNRSGTSVTEHQ